MSDPRMIPLPDESDDDEFSRSTSHENPHHGNDRGSRDRRHAIVSDSPAAVSVNDVVSPVRDAFAAAAAAADSNFQRNDVIASPSPSPASTQRAGIVKLNIGGFKFTTSLSTLCSFPDSFFEIMFSGRQPNPSEIDPVDGSFFVDRDGTHFRHILNFLRVGYVVSLPDSETEREELIAEADFYGLDDMVKGIRSPHVDVSKYLTDEMLRIREEEMRLRAAWLTDQKPGQHEGLIPLFCSNHYGSDIQSEGWKEWRRYGYVTAKEPENYVQIEPELILNPHRLSSNKPCGDGVQVTVRDRPAFRSTFNRHHPNVLHRLDNILKEEPAVIAGGSVLRALLMDKNPRHSEWLKDLDSGDIDVFLCGVDSTEATRIARRIFYALASASDNERWVVVRGAGVINVHHRNNDHSTEVKVQIVLRLYESPAEVLLGFDVDCCCCAYDGSDVWVTKRWVSALQSGINTLNPLHAWPNRPSYEFRLGKYAYRGFAVHVPGLVKNRVDYDRITRSRLGQLKGMSRLLKIAMEMESSYYNVMPQTIEALRLDDIELKCCSETGLLLEGKGDYDELGFNVIVPKAYGGWFDDEPTGAMWYDYVFEFPAAGGTRDGAWEEIENCEDPPERVPARLVDAWDTEKRSREYLNAKMDSFDLDNVYYGQAYKE